jgi:hypothetical protein
MYLDSQGLVALWREGLLAQAVLRGRTRGYKSHPQLTRFRAQHRPLAAIAIYLACVCEEADARGYNFDRAKIGRSSRCDRIEETRGQLMYEWEHLRRKLKARCPERYKQILRLRTPHAHPLFLLGSGPVRDWERVGPVKPARGKNQHT